jgi:hypothetical protein
VASLDPWHAAKPYGLGLGWGRVRELDLPRDRAGRLIPTGECWCGCEEVTTPGNYFSSGHDKFAEAAVINLEYGSVAELLIRHGFGPGGRNARAELTEWRAGGGRTR